MLDIYSVIEDIRFRTSLLESLEWDEDLLETFLIYFDGEIKNGTNPEILLNDIKDYFGKNVYDIIVKLFLEEASKLDRYLNNKDEDH